MSTPDPTVVQREAGWLTAQTGVTAACGEVLPYVRRPSAHEDRRAMLRRTGMSVFSFDSGHDAREHALLLILDWPSGENLAGGALHLDGAVETLVELLRADDRTHDGLWAASADSGAGYGPGASPDITISWTDPDDPVAAGSDGRLQAQIAYAVTEIIPRA